MNEKRLERRHGVRLAQAPVEQQGDRSIGHSHGAGTLERPLETLASQARMSQPGAIQGACERRELLLPGRGAGFWELDLGCRDLDRGVHQVALAGEVAVERHRPHAELGRQPPHRQPLGPVRVHDLERPLREFLPRVARGGSPSPSLHRMKPANLASSG
jgi:hypothetical protein